MWRQSISSNRGKAIYYPKWYKQYIQHFGLCRDLLQIIGYEIADHTKSTFFLPLALSITAISFYMFAVGIARFINWKYITNLLVNIFLNYNMLEKVLNIEITTHCCTFILDLISEYIIQKDTKEKTLSMIGVVIWLNQANHSLRKNAYFILLLHIAV